MPRRRSRSRRVVWTVIVLLVLGTLGAGAAYLIRRGRGSNDPFRRAVAAQRAGDLESAEAQARALLDEDVGHEGARALLIQLLSTSGRIEEAESLAQFWRDRPADEVKGLRALGQLALQRGDHEQAVRMARLVADRDPAFSQSMLMQVQDLRGTPVDRDGAARAAENLGRLASAPPVRAAAFLFAAETLRDLEREAANVEVRRELAERCEMDRREARGAALTQVDPRSGELLSPGDSKALMGRIQLLSKDDAEQLQGRETLETLLEAEPDQHAARASLIAYYLGASMPAKAIAEARELADAPPLIALRCIGALAGAGEVEAALELLAALTSLPDDARALMEARILTGGTDAQRTEGLGKLEELAAAEPENLALAQEVFSRLEAQGDPERAIQLLERLATSNSSLRVAALRERAARAVATGQREQASVLINQLAAVATLEELPGLYVRLQGAGGPSDGTAWALLGRALAAGVADPTQVRLLRATVTASRPGAAPDGRAWSEHTREDLEALAEAPDLPAAVLVRAAMAARAADERDLVGRLLGRALTAPAGSEVALDPYLRLVGEVDAALRQVVAQGVREGAAPEGAGAAWAGTLADALVAGDGAALRRSSQGEGLAGSPPGTETALQLLLAARARDWAEAEAFARQRLDAAPPAERERALEHLGAVLMDAGKYQEVLALHAAETLPAPLRAQRAWALDRLGRGADAIAEARKLVAETGGSDRALVVLAQILSKRDPDAALAAAAAAPASWQGAFLRADLLERRGDEEAALVVFEDLLRASQDRNLAAWQGLARVLMAAGRGADLVRRLTAALEGMSAAARPQDVAALFLLRGQAYEQDRAYEAALADYQRVLELAKDHPVALNNAAWLMSSGLVRPTTTDTTAWQERALDMVERATRVAPKLAPLHHTRGKILLALERRDAARAAFDQAIELYGAQPVPEETDRRTMAQAMAMRVRLAGYLLDKAKLLVEMGEAEAARELFESIVTTYPRTFPASEANKSLEALRR